VLLMCHNEETRDDPWQFRLDRFLDEDGQLLSRSTSEVGSIFMFIFKKVLITLALYSCLF